MGERLKASAHYCERKQSPLYQPELASFRVPAGLIANTRAALMLLLRAVLGKNLKQQIGISYLYLPFLWLFKRKHYSNNSLCIDITEACNLKCFNCQASVRQAPSSDSFSVSQMEKFVNEAIDLRYYWDRISFFGGEPTLHPQFFELLSILKRYKDFNPECLIDVVSNGAGSKVKAVLAELPDWVSVECSRKKEWQEAYPFGTYNIAPVDLPAHRFFSDFSMGCPLLTNCYGLGLSRYGYYPCSPCMHTDRVFGFDVGIKNLSEVNEKRLRNQMKALCRYCGWFKPIWGLTMTEQISPSWKKAYLAYEKQKPALSVYGG